MDRSTLTRIGAAGAVAGLGLAVGGVALASAETTAPSGTTSSAHPGGPRGDRDQDAEVLASELGLEESVVEEALTAVRDELRPERSTDADTETKPTPPTEEERAEHQAALVTALAEKLDVSEAKVEAAYAVIEEKREAERTERQAESRADLVTRLDEAVTAGTLTEADKASVLKAYDADLLGGPGGPGGHGGPGGGGRPSSDAAAE
ncbi:hypothetical protein [Nocardioides lianchengensis]|uniref:Uncharacterized protein n=1 Tax=Nocardioides lianchengensis TaxID=1045774 RepID=A0A1G6WBB1_9ACTN|nr:hypothetical protein [Nocardioides lianchengensis]NYG09376.1 hypothetical protein [Nocardioides lianchengensis]SDD63108.1 hypothetical protein SAMN05421872_109233 [Nocardioides lianchengensis]